MFNHYYLAFLRIIAPTARYIFSPNPGGAQYGDTGMMSLLILALALIILAFVVRIWRARSGNPVTKKLSRSWGSALLWFAVADAFLVVCRVEGIQFLAMRLLWVLWIIGALVYVYFQVRQFRARHYEVLPKIQVTDPLARYIPGKRKH